MLALATPQQKVERDRLAHEAWGQTLTADQFLVREERLRAHAFSQEGMRTWVLLGDDGSILSSCETFRMRSFVRGSVEGTSYAVASVLTERALRGRGYAVRMMSLLVDRIRESDPAAHAMVLYSDVGARIYERSGYVAIPRGDRAFEPLDGDPSEGVELFGDADVERALSEIPLPRADFLIWPTSSQIDWHLERERVYSEALRRTRPEACGARVGGSTMLWAASFKANDLNVLLLHAESQSELASLLRAARRTAGRAGLGRVACWEHAPRFEWPEGPDGGSSSERDGALPMICPIDASIDPSSWSLIPKALWV